MRRMVATVLVICATGFKAQGQVAEYAVKIVCGIPDRQAVAPGRYFTAINVHNPAITPARIQFKVATTLPNVGPGQISGFFSAALKPDQALEIDCMDVGRRLGTGDRFVKGFVVIQGSVELDVVGVYTATSAPDGRVVVLELERVPVRPIRR